ncbi:MAG: prolyl oligopeptidase family serine peptidase [Bacteroidia bacterium]
MKHTTYLFSIILLATACNQKSATVQEQLNYPYSIKSDHKDNYFGTEVADPYHWLENENSDTTAQWVDKQNEVTFAYLDKIPFRKQIKDRLTQLWNYPKFGAPFKSGNKYFMYRNNGLQNQSILFQMDKADAEGKELIDPNKLSTDGTVSLTMFTPDRKGDFAAYGTSSGGSDWNEFFVLDLNTGKKTTDHLQWIKFSGASWYKNGFFYCRYDAPVDGKELSAKNEHHKVYYHRLGNDQSKDELVYHDASKPQRYYDIGVTEDERFMLMHISEGAASKNAVSVRDLSKEGSSLQPLINDFESENVVIDNMGDQLIVLTNRNAPHKKVVLIDPANPNEKNWKELIAERKDEVLESISYTGGKLLAVYMKDATSRVYVFDAKGKQEAEVQLPALGTVSGFSGHREDKEVYFTFTSFTYPSCVYKYDITTNTTTLFKKPDIKFDFEQYETKQVFAKSIDGTKVPMFLVHKKGIKLDGNNPALLYGYGGFNISLTPSFSISNLVFLEQGGIYALANLRGGGEYGEEWHEAGMLLKKQNVFNDFIACAEFLINEKYTSSQKLAIKGGSNGGLLVGAVMCQRPELFKVALPAVGVMDMLRYHKFTIGWGWIGEYGSSDSLIMFKNLLLYSPLHNLKEGVNYPATLVTTADHDDRVVPAHSYKFTARLQACHKGNNPVLIRIDKKAGHGAGKPTSKLIDEATDQWAFTFYNLGMKME